MGQSDMFSLAGKVIVVTGGTGVLGAGFVKGLQPKEVFQLSWVRMWRKEMKE